MTALLFEAEELRFLSAGTDGKLLSTHTRGKLEPEDRGRGANHTEPVPALVWAPGDRFLTGSRDSSVKTWARADKTKPATLKDGVAKVLDLTTVTIQDKPQLVIACQDNTLRLFALNPDGRFGDATFTLRDATARAKHELSQPEGTRREAALKGLAEFNDMPSVELIAEQVSKDPDHTLRLLAVQLLSASSHGRAPKLLEKALQHKDDAVTLAALAGLRRHLGETNLRPLELALKTEKAEVGKAALAALETLAKKDDQALARLTAALDASSLPVHMAALTSLERVYPADSAEADLTALNSKHPDMRRLGLVRLFQRQLLGGPRAGASVRRRLEDQDAGVRHAAFLVSLHARPKVVAELRKRDPDLQRQLLELEGKPAAELPAEQAEAIPPKMAPAKLTEADLEPLVQATASRALDVCLHGARGLAVLADPRAFGLLLQLSREEVPLLALDALVDDDARKPLAEALRAPFDDVRVRAAAALARHGEREALAVLLELATRPEPKERERQADCLDLAVRAVRGLEALGEPAALTDVLRWLDSPHAQLRQAAAEALVWVSRPEQLEPLRAALQHSDAHVKYRAALGLTVAGDVFGAALVFSDAARQILKPEEQMTAALCLGAAGEDQLAVFLDHADDNVRRQALLLLMMLELKAHGGTPARCLACLSSRMPRVRLTAAEALELATKKDSAAFDALVRLLKSQEDAKRQARIIDALEKLGDPRAPDAYMDRVEDDPSGTAQVDALLGAAGRFRRPENADRLLKMMAKEPKWRGGCFSALLTISGHDQSIDDPEEENPDRTWETKQHPRRDAVLARLLERCVAFGDTNLITRLMTAARWARGNEVDATLAGLVSHPQQQLRQTVVELLGWRLRKRKGSAEPLLKSLQHRDPNTQFLAAEGLARAGRAEGLIVLLSAVEFMTDYNLRQRAVVALGELGDQRALDTLLRLASEDGHALQDVAAEALGHLGKSDKAEEILKLLTRFAKSQGSVSGMALRGLRWLNTHAAWQVIRARAADPSNYERDTAIELLGYNDDPATRDLILRELRVGHDCDIEGIGMPAARRLWGTESLEPDYALIQNANQQGYHEYQESLKRVCQRGEARRIFALFASTPEGTQEELATTLLNRPNLPVAEVATALASHHERTVQLGAELLGRAGAATEEVAKALGVTLEKWLGAWEERRRVSLRSGRHDDDALARMTPCLERLIWAAGRLGVAQAVLLRAAAMRPDDPLFRPVRHRALAALAQGSASKEATAMFDAATADNDPEARLIAADGLARQQPERAAAQAERLLSDAVAFRRVVAAGIEVTKTLRGAAAQVHYQGVALPHLIERGDVGALAAVAADKKLPEATRSGAVEALGKLARPDAEDRLAQIGKDEKEDEELRKAAWRALRRSKRERKKSTTKGHKDHEERKKTDNKERNPAGVQRLHAIAFLRGLCDLCGSIIGVTP